MLNQHILGQNSSVLFDTLLLPSSLASFFLRYTKSSILSAFHWSNYISITYDVHLWCFNIYALVWSLMHVRKAYRPHHLNVKYRSNAYLWNSDVHSWYLHVDPTPKIQLQNFRKFSMHITFANKLKLTPQLIYNMTWRIISNSFEDSLSYIQQHYFQFLSFNITFSFSFILNGRLQIHQYRPVPLVSYQFSMV